MSSMVLSEYENSSFNLQDYLRDSFQLNEPFLICDPHFHLWDMSEMFNSRLGLKLKPSVNSKSVNSVISEETISSKSDQDESCHSNIDFVGGKYSDSNEKRKVV